MCMIVVAASSESTHCCTVPTLMRSLRRVCGPPGVIIWRATRTGRSGSVGLMSLTVADLLDQRRGRDSRSAGEVLHRADVAELVEPAGPVVAHDEYVGGVRLDVVA